MNHRFEIKNVGLLAIFHVFRAVGLVTDLRTSQTPLLYSLRLMSEATLSKAIVFED